MSALLVGGLGFLLFYPTDWLGLRGLALARSGMLLLGAAAQGCGFFLALRDSERLSLPEIAVWLGWGLLPVAFCLLVYSLFVEIPFTSAYLRRVNASWYGGELVTTGTYALTRHPGVLWYALFVLALVLVSRSMELLIAAPVWVALDVFWVVLQDRIFFPRMFAGYWKYAEVTPMLIPTKESIKACLATLGAWKG